MNCIDNTALFVNIHCILLFILACLQFLEESFAMQQSGVAEDCKARNTDNLAGIALLGVVLHKEQEKISPPPECLAPA